MDAKSPLNDLRIATPCPADWSRMKGDEQVRFCQACNKHIYNLSSMTSGEAIALLQRTEGRACLRLYRRRDGTVITADCPLGVAAALKRRLKRLAKVAAAVLGLSGVNSLLKAKEMWPYAPLVNPLPAIESWAGGLLRFGNSCRGSLWGNHQVVMGKIAPASIGTPAAPDGPPPLTPAYPSTDADPPPPTPAYPSTESDPPSDFSEEP
jgi:hypothetical protein